MAERVQELGSGSSAPSLSGLAFEDILSGQPIYVKRVGGNIALADGTTEEKATVIGLAAADIDAGMVGDIDTEFHEEIDWTSIIGSVNLSVGLRYYLDLLTPGSLTSAAPTDGDIGKFSMEVGVAVTTKTLELTLQQPIGL